MKNDRVERIGFCSSMNLFTTGQGESRKNQFEFRCLNKRQKLLPKFISKKGPRKRVPSHPTVKMYVLNYYFTSRNRKTYC